MAEWKGKWGSTLQRNLNTRSHRVTEGWGGGVSVKQLQVSDGHFAILVAALAHQPIRIHTDDAADDDHLRRRGLGLSFHSTKVRHNNSVINSTFICEGKLLTSEKLIRTWRCTRPLDSFVSDTKLYEMRGRDSCYYQSQLATGRVESVPEWEI